jgi:hypothetical protein
MFICDYVIPLCLISSAGWYGNVINMRHNIPAATPGLLTLPASILGYGLLKEVEAKSGYLIEPSKGNFISLAKE